MKRLYTVLALVALLAGVVRAQVLSPQQALAKALGTTTMKKVKAVDAPAYKLVKTVEAEGQPTLYLYTPASGQGYLLVAAEGAAETVLAYSAEGALDADNLPVALQEWMDGYTAEIAAYRANPVQVRKAEPSFGSIVPMIATKWGMGEPYNWNAPTGFKSASLPSHAVAAAQIMYYHKWPLRGAGSVNYTVNNKATGYVSVRLNPDFSTYEIAWGDMLEEYVGDNYSYDNTDAVSDLMFNLSMAMKVKFSDESSVTTIPAVSNAVAAIVDNFGYKKSAITIGRSYYTRAEWEQILYSQLQQGQPVLYYGTATSRGHAMVCDGYKDGMFHFNLCWDGVSDGYYKLNAIVPADGDKEFDVAGYNNNQSMIIDIVPDREGSETDDYVQHFTTASFVLSEAEDGIEVKGSFANSSIEPKMGELGVCLTSDAAEQYVTGIAIDESNLGKTIPSYVISLAGVADGTYQVKPVFRTEGGEWTAVRVNVAYDPVLTIHVSGGVATIEEPKEIEPKVWVSHSPMSIYTEEFNEMEIKVYNPSESKDYTGYIAGYFVDDSDNILYTPSAYVTVRVGAGETNTYTYKERYTAKADATPEGTGTTTGTGTGTGTGTSTSTGGGTTTTTGNDIEPQVLKYRLALSTKDYQFVKWLSGPIELWIGPRGAAGAIAGTYDDADAIQTVGAAQPEQQGWFNLQGQPVKNPAHGIFINQRGQKVVVR